MSNVQLGLTENYQYRGKELLSWLLLLLFDSYLAFCPFFSRVEYLTVDLPSLTSAPLWGRPRYPSWAQQTVAVAARCKTKWLSWGWPDDWTLAFTITLLFTPSVMRVAVQPFGMTLADMWLLCGKVSKAGFAHTQGQQKGPRHKNDIPGTVPLTVCLSTNPVSSLCLNLLLCRIWVVYLDEWQFCSVWCFPLPSLGYALEGWLRLHLLS